MRFTALTDPPAETTPARAYDVLEWQRPLLNRLPQEWRDAFKSPVAASFYCHRVGLDLETAKRNHPELLKNRGASELSATKPKTREPSRADAAKPFVEKFGREKGSVFFARNLTLQQAEAEQRREECEMRAAEGKPYIELYGADGAVYFANGMSLSEAHAEHARTRLSRLSKSVMAEFGKSPVGGSSDMEFRAEPTTSTPPAAVAPPADDVPYACRNGCGSDAVAALAASIKMPGK